MGTKEPILIDDNKEDANSSLDIQHQGIEIFDIYENVEKLSDQILNTEKEETIQTKRKRNVIPTNNTPQKDEERLELLQKDAIETETKVKT